MSLKNLSVKNKVHRFFNRKLSNKKINNIYKKFEKSLDINEKFLVAVSGGPDSLALAFLAKTFSLKKKIPSSFVIIDHGLRKDSKKEAENVKKVLKKNHINAEILTWRGKKPSTNIQSLARNERYNLLHKKCEDENTDNILVGHHQDDLIENFFIRIMRGSGLRGLVSLGKKTMIRNKNLIRPLINQKKDDLTFISKNVFKFYIQDPSNKDEKYQRVRLRNLINKFKKEGLDHTKILKMIKNLKHSDSVIGFYVKENLKHNTHFNKEKDKMVINSEFFLQPYEIIFRSLSNAIKIIGHKYYFVRGKKLDLIIEKIMKNPSIKVTLGGCIIKKVNQTVILTKE